MRLCSASAVRILTLFSLAVLSSHSFVNAQSSSEVSLTPSLPAEASPVSSEPPTEPSVTTTPNPPSVSSSAPPPSSPPVVPSSSKQSQPASSSPSTPAQASVQSSSSSSPSSSSQSSSSSSVSSSSSSASSISSSSSSSSKASITPSVQQTVTGGRTSYVYGSTDFSVPTPSSSSDAAEATGATATTSTSFLKNKPAVIGVFTVAGVVGLLIIAFIAMKIMRRRARMRDEEDDAYFEKYPEHEPPVHPGSGPMDSSYDISDATAPARHDAYPDRSMHYGSEQAYANPNQYGMEYPPGTAYAAAAAQDGQYQYSGQNEQYSGQNGQYSPTGGHPFADPQNTLRHGVAPPVHRPYDQDPYAGYAQ